MSSTPYVFYSYSIINYQSDEEVHPSKHFSIFKSVHKAPIAYRKQDPSEADKDTQLVVLKDMKIGQKQVITFFISRQIVERQINLYRKNKDEVELGVEKTDDTSLTRFVVVPHLKKMAIQDKSGEHFINANSAISRLKKILSEVAEHTLISEYAASAEDVRKALAAWKIDEVNFTARPFNPHPSTPGDIFSAQMAENNSIVTGRVKAKKGVLEHIKKGFIGEILGLSEKGYADIGAKGKTQQGHVAQIIKSNPFEDVNAPRKIRIMMPERGEVSSHIEDIVEAMEQIYGKNP